MSLLVQDLALIQASLSQKVPLSLELPGCCRDGCSAPKARGAWARGLCAVYYRGVSLNFWGNLNLIPPKQIKMHYLERFLQMQLEQQVLSPHMCRGALRLQEQPMEQGRGVREYRPHWGVNSVGQPPQKIPFPNFFLFSACLMLMFPPRAS